MDDVIDLLEDIKELLISNNEKLTDIQDQLSDIKGYGVFDSISDIYDKLESIDLSISMLD